MRVAVVSESFLPTINGVTTSVVRVLDHLKARGHEAIVLCPTAGAPSSYNGFPVYEMPTFAYRQFPVGLPSPQVQRLIADFAPDVVHAASPFLLGAQAIAAANHLGIASVAIYQTDVAGYAQRNKLGAARGIARRFVRWVHESADLTLAPSSVSMNDLADLGVPRVERWGRGVDLELFHPRNRLSPGAVELRRALAPHGELVVGYVGRVAPEKQLERLSALEGLGGMRLAIVGDGPSMAKAAHALAKVSTTFLGALRGADLADAYGAFDVFVHPGTEETFGQTIQEAHAAGLPVIAPRAGGPIDLIEPGVDGYLFAPDDDAALRGYVWQLAENPALRARMGEAGRRRVLDRSWDVVCDRLLDHYAVTIAARVKTGRPFRTVSMSR